MAELGKQTLLRLAEEKLRDSKLLLEAGSWSNAYYLAGYAIELMLKAVLSSQFKPETIPRREWVANIFTHNLSVLIGLADLQQALSDKRDAEPEFDGRWEIVLAWKETSRYDICERDDAEDLLQAIEHPKHGVLQWLRTML